MNEVEKAQMISDAFTLQCRVGRLGGNTIKSPLRPAWEALREAVKALQKAPAAELATIGPNDR